MRLLDLVAVPHPAGNRIDLTWRHPAPIQFPGVRVVRREGAYPLSPIHIKLRLSSWTCCLQ
jgi:hypothetical protein